jgi:hypothetical protein
VARYHGWDSAETERHAELVLAQAREAGEL